MSTWAHRPAGMRLPGERLADAAGRARTAAAGASRRLRRPAPGLVLAVLVAVAATALGHRVPIVGGPVFGILLGVALGALVRPGAVLTPGIEVAARPVLQLSIVVLGTGLSLGQVFSVGVASLPVMIGTLAVALGGGWALGRVLGVHGDTRTLVAVGTGICGASAIAATTAVIDAKRTDVAYALGTIFVFNIAAVLAFPAVGHLLHLDAHAFGLWAGTAVNDTSSVVAAALSYGGDAGQYAIVVKLTRTLMLIPVVVALALLRARRESGGMRRLPWRRVVPLFLLGFLAAAALDSLGVVPAAWHPALSSLGTFLITTALAGIGLGMRLSDIRAAGPRPLLMGGILWVAVAASSLGLQALTGSS